MPYNKLLKDIIDNSNYKNKEIIEKLEKEDIHIDKSYLSKLLNGKLPAPREEVSRAIAKVCNADERSLIIEGYFDKAPQEIKDILYYIKKISNLSASAIYSNIADVFDKKTLELLDIQIEQESINDFLLYILDCKENDILDLTPNGLLSVSSNKENFSFQLEEPVAFIIDDDDMYPIIPKNSKITLEIPDKYENGDIVALKYNYIITTRYYFKNNNNVSFNAISKNADFIDNKNKTLKILGKVKKVITEIQ